jgi:hypothetical protein
VARGTGDFSDKLTQGAAPPAPLETMIRSRSALSRRRLSWRFGRPQLILNKSSNVESYTTQIATDFFDTGRTMG